MVTDSETAYGVLMDDDNATPDRAKGSALTIGFSMTSLLWELNGA